MNQWAQTWMTSLFWIPENTPTAETTVVGDLWENPRG